MEGVCKSTDSTNIKKSTSLRPHWLADGVKFYIKTAQDLPASLYRSWRRSKPALKYALDSIFRKLTVCHGKLTWR